MTKNKSSMWSQQDWSSGPPDCESDALTTHSATLPLKCPRELQAYPFSICCWYMFTCTFVRRQTVLLLVLLVLLNCNLRVPLTLVKEKKNTQWAPIMSKGFHLMAQPVSQPLDRVLPPWLVSLHIKGGSPPSSELQIKRTRHPSHWLINRKNNMGAGGGVEGGRDEGKCKIQRLNKT